MRSLFRQQAAVFSHALTKFPQLFFTEIFDLGLKIHGVALRANMTETLLVL
jgi:hypothetical protein